MYIEILPIVILIFGLRVQCVSGVSAYLILWAFAILEFVSQLIIGTLWSLFTFVIIVLP